MIPPDVRAEIRRLFFAERWTVGTIAEQLHVHYYAVKRAIEAERFIRTGAQIRPSLLDPYKAFVGEVLEKYPRFRATRLFEMVKERGYTGLGRPAQALRSRRRGPPRRARRSCALSRCRASRPRWTGATSARSNRPRQPGPLLLRDGALVVARDLRPVRARPNAGELPARARRGIQRAPRRPQDHPLRQPEERCAGARRRSHPLPPARPRPRRPLPLRAEALRAVPDCGFERLVAFSCKAHVCPSCNARRMEDTAEHLVRNVFPAVPVRQWVLSFPRRVRFLAARHPALVSRLLDLFTRSVFAWQRRAARRLGTAEPRTGGVNAVQRFGGAINLNVHFHTLIPDGVFVVGGNGPARFVPILPPCDEELTAILTPWSEFDQPLDTLDQALPSQWRIPDEPTAQTSLAEPPPHAADPARRPAQRVRGTRPSAAVPVDDCAVRARRPDVARAGPPDRVQGTSSAARRSGP